MNSLKRLGCFIGSAVLMWALVVPPLVGDKGIDLESEPTEWPVMSTYSTEPECQQARLRQISLYQKLATGNDDPGDQQRLLAAENSQCVRPEASLATPP